MRQTIRPGAIGLLGILLALTGGCTRPIQKPMSPVDVPRTFSIAGTAPMPEKWWRAFDDPKLEALIERALTDNLSLQVAWDRLVQAHALARQANASLWPRADFEAGAGKTYQDTSRGRTDSSLYRVGVAAGYEVDLWDRLGSTRKAAWLEVQASQDAVDTAAITLAASVASTWYQLAEAKELVRIAQAQIQTNEKVLEVVTIQFRKNIASAADVFRQRQLVASTKATLIAAEETVALLQYTLSVLIGEPPRQTWGQTEIAFPTLTPTPRLGVPSDVLLRRPDVRQALRRVQAADQRMAAAIANQYPRISLSASIDTSATSVRDLFDDWFANLAANAVQPLFDGKQRKAEVARQKALVRENVHRWSLAVLDALTEVETALTQEQQQAQRLANLNVQLELARETYKRNRESFIKGQVDYIRVLESLQSLQGLELRVIAAQQTLVQRRIDLYRSLAGPFDLPQPAFAEAWNADDTTPNPQNKIQDKQVQP